MNVLPMQTSQTFQKMGSLYGGIVSNETIRNVNKRWMGGKELFFGTEKDPLREQYLSFTNTIKKEEMRTRLSFDDLEEAISPTEKLKAISSDDDLWNINDRMRECCIMQPSLRELLKDDSIYGWGYEYDDLPEEDVIGRMISNGEWSSHDDDDDNELVRFFSSHDPDLSDEELDCIQISRDYIDSFLDKEKLSRKDPTSHCGRIE